MEHQDHWKSNNGRKFSIYKSGKRSREDSIIYCQKCETEVEVRVACSGCKLGLCLKCAQVSPALYECIERGELSNFHFNCASCEATFPSLENITSILERKPV